MRVLYDYQTFSIRQYGGITRYFAELASHISRLPGVHAQVAGPVLYNQFLAAYQGHISTVGVNIERFEGLPPRVISRINRTLFPAVASLLRPDIVHETFYEPRRTAPRGAKVVTTIHDMIPERLPQHFPNYREHRARIRAVLERVDGVICVSESTRRDLLELCDVPAERVFVVRLASSLAVRGEPAKLDAPYFLYVGARFEYKNFDVLLKAFGAAQLYRTHKLVVFSVHRFTDAELKAMDREGVPRSCVIAAGGEDEELARYYAGAESLVFPSQYEGFGIPLVEAMRCGCPVIASDSSSLPEVGGDASLYCAAGDADSLAAAMQRVAASAELRGEMAARGRARAQFFSWEKCAAETHALYKDLLGE